MDSSEWYWWLKKHHVCTQCKKTDAYTLNGRSRCYECTKANTERHKKSYAKNREAMQKKAKEKYQQNKENGICVECEKRPAAYGTRLCAKCRADEINRQRKRREKQGIIPRYLFDGIERCQTCGKTLTDENIVKGKKLCKGCYAKHIKSLEKARTVWSNSSKAKSE